MERVCSFFFFGSVKTSRITADEVCQETLEFYREVVVLLAASHPSTLLMCY